MFWACGWWQLQAQGEIFSLLAALLCWHRNSFVLMPPCASKEGNLDVLV
jgi:hypothetical protein